MLFMSKVHCLLKQQAFTWNKIFRKVDTLILSHYTFHFGFSFSVIRGYRHLMGWQNDPSAVSCQPINWRNAKNYHYLPHPPPAIGGGLGPPKHRNHGLTSHQLLHSEYQITTPEMNKYLCRHRFYPFGVLVALAGLKIICRNISITLIPSQKFEPIWR